MNKLIITSLAAVAILAGCGKSDDAAKAAPKTGATAPVTAPVKAEVTPEVVAPKPPPPPGGGKSAPELKPEDIARIQAMLKKQAAPAAAVPAAK